VPSARHSTIGLSSRTGTQNLETGIPADRFFPLWLRFHMGSLAHEWDRANQKIARFQLQLPRGARHGFGRARDFSVVGALHREIARLEREAIEQVRRRNSPRC